MVYLKRSVRRRFGSTVSVRLVSPDSKEARELKLSGVLPRPVILVDGEVFCWGRLSLKEVVGEVQRRRGR